MSAQDNAASSSDMQTPHEKKELENMTEKEKKMEKMKIMKNVLLISASFLMIFNAFQGLSRLQSSLHKVDGMGTTNMSLLYAALVLSCLVVPKPLIRTIGHKWTIPLCFCGYIIWMGANGHGKWASMAPASVLVGLSAAPLWTAQCAYFIAVAGKYAKLTGETCDNIVTRFFGIFFFFFQLSSITGSIISSTILEPVLENGTNIDPTDEQLESCGVDDCPDNAFSNPNLQDPEDSTVWTMVGVYMGIACLGLVITILFVDQLPEDIDPRVGDNSTVVDLVLGTIRQLRLKYQLILIPLTMYSGFEQSFYAAEFSRSYAGCTLGVWEIGLVTIPFGVVNCIVSFTTGRVVKYTGRIPVFTAGLVVDIAIQATLAFWQPDPDQAYVLYIISGMWGFTDGIWQTQINALYGVLFTNEPEAAFANYRMWESLGFIIAFAYSEHLCTKPKLIVVTCFLIIGYVGFCIVMAMERKRKQNTPANINNLKMVYYRDQNAVYENKAVESNVVTEDTRAQRNNQYDVTVGNI